MDKFARSENDNKMSKCSRQWRLALSQASNTALALAVVAATLALRKGIIPPARRGFNCADKTITFPTKEEFLSTGTLLGTGLLVTLGVIVFVEYFAGMINELIYIAFYIVFVTPVRDLRSVS